MVRLTIFFSPRRSKAGFYLETSRAIEATLLSTQISGIPTVCLHNDPLTAENAIQKRSNGRLASHFYSRRNKSGRSQRKPLKITRERGKVNCQSLEACAADGIIKGTGYSFSHSAAGHANAVCLPGRTSPLLQLANLFSRRFAVDSNTRERRPIDPPLWVRSTVPSMSDPLPTETDQSIAVVLNSTTPIPPRRSINPSAPGSVRRIATQ